MDRLFGATLFDLTREEAAARPWNLEPSDLDIELTDTEGLPRPEHWVSVEQSLTPLEGRLAVRPVVLVYPHARLAIWHGLETVDAVTELLRGGLVMRLPREIRQAAEVLVAVRLAALLHPEFRVVSTGRVCPGMNREPGSLGAEHEQYLRERADYVEADITSWNAALALIGEKSEALADEVVGLLRGKPVRYPGVALLDMERLCEAGRHMSAAGALPSSALRRLVRLPGVLAADGRPLALRAASDLIWTPLQQTADELVELLADQPELLRSLDPSRFEQVIAELLVGEGCEVNIVSGPGDGGIDIVAIRRDPLHTATYLVQCKRHAAHRGVGVAVVRDLLGVVEATRATAGLVATTSYFTTPAQTFRSQQSVRARLSLHDFLSVSSWLQARRRGAPGSQGLQR